MAAKFFTGLPLDGPDPECVQGYGETALAARDLELVTPRSHLDHSHTGPVRGQPTLLGMPGHAAGEDLRRVPAGGTRPALTTPVSPPGGRRGRYRKCPERADPAGVILELRDRAARLLPEGRLLPEAVWQRRHRAIVRLCLLSAAALVLLRLAPGLRPARRRRRPAGRRRTRRRSPSSPSSAARARPRRRRVSLMAASAALVHLWQGVTESHFIFFVMIGVVSLYQDWVPYGIALVMVIAHHGIVGTLYPHAVFSHDAAAQPLGVGRDPRRLRARREPRPPGRLAAERGPGPQRPAHRAGQPHAARGDHPPGAAPRRRGAACCSSTSTTSRASTTAAATPPATSSCSSSPSGCAAACGPATSSPASAATSSPSSSTAVRTSPRRSASGCSSRSPSRSPWTTAP